MIASFKPIQLKVMVKGPGLCTVALWPTTIERQRLEIISAGFLTKCLVSC